MSKIYKITSTIFHSERLKSVNFHGKGMPPLYIRIVYSRNSTFLKSYYFDLYEHPRYLNRTLAGNKAPSIENIVEKEQELIEFIKLKNPDNFSIELFKNQYHHYSRNILALMEEPFLNYLITFFQDEGQPVLASMLKDTGGNYRCELLMEDLKSLVKPLIFKKLLENAVFYAPPYIPLTAFANSLKENLVAFLPVYLWDNPKLNNELTSFLEQKFPEYDKKSALNYVKQIIG